MGVCDGLIMLLLLVQGRHRHGATTAYTCNYWHTVPYNWQRAGPCRLQQREAKFRLALQ